jgi:hypothetical protein
LKSKQCHCDENKGNQVPHFLKERFLIPVHHPYSDFEDCGDFFDINLAGLTDSANFELVKFIGRKVEIETTSCTEGNKIRGKIYNVGIDFIELLKENGRIVMILKDNISQIHW